MSDPETALPPELQRVLEPLTDEALNGLITKLLQELLPLPYRSTDTMHVVACTLLQLATAAAKDPRDAGRIAKLAVDKAIQLSSLVVTPPGGVQ